ncbi:MAG: S1 RNA-binding domain-containing protein [Oscillospiraceae bacterium]|jgi:S1 RNA binding domain protein|nr:S1 RNA-binding domain-containing protein [Oscillospiraceae bacterium]
MAIGVGDIVGGKVTGITKYAAFVALDGGKSGMVHISEISHNYVNDIREHLREEQEVTVKVIGIDETGRINLSIKKTAPPPMTRERQPMRASAAPQTFEDKLKQFMHDSESRVSGMKSERRVSRKKGK